MTELTDEDDQVFVVRTDAGTVGAVRLGEVVAAHPGRVLMSALVGGLRVVDMLVGEQPPRIC